MSAFGLPISANFRDAIRTIEPSRVAVFLREQRWKREKPWKDKGHDWVTPEGEHVLVPSDPGIRLYAETLASIFEMFISPGVLFEDIVVMAQFGTCDILRRRIDEPNTQAGSCSLEEARSEIVGLKELLMWSSRRYAQKRQNPSRLATSYLAQCRAGQTEVGSYVLKVYAPVAIHGSPIEQSAFGREVTLAATQNVTYFAAEDYSPEDPLPPAMDWHVAESIMRMKSDAGIWGEKNELSVRFVESSITADDDGTQPADKKRELVVAMTGEVFSRAATVWETLKSGEMFERLVFTGHITDLHKNEPNAKKKDQRITIRTYLGGNPRNITMRLMPTDYRRAVEWHDKEVLVQVDAKIDKRWRTWTAAEYYDIQALLPEAQDAVLFEQ